MKFGMSIFFSGGWRRPPVARPSREMAFIFEKLAGSNLLDRWSLLQVTNLDFEEFGNLPRFPNSPLTGLTRLG
jgi:hypothetical protein